MHGSGGQGVAGSNPVSPTTQTPLETRIQGASDTATHTPSLTQSLTRTENRVADPNQFPLAARLAEELETAGHDNIHTLDILDCVGTAGLRLAEGGDAAVVTYHLSLVEDNEQPPPA